MIVNIDRDIMMSANNNNSKPKPQPPSPPPKNLPEQPKPAGWGNASNNVSRGRKSDDNPNPK